VSGASDPRPDAGGVEDVPPPRPQFKIRTLQELMGLESPEQLIEGVIGGNDLALIYAPSNAGKTFLALDMSLAVATGMKWAGRDVQQGQVLYVSAEGIAGLPRRILAWLDGTPEEVQRAADQSFFCLTQAVQLVQGEVEALIKAIDLLAIEPTLIVIDTLARCFLGGDENNAQDMTTFVAACDRLRQHYGGAVLIVHHSGKNGQTERGSSALRGAADAVMACKRTERLVELTCEKQKDAAEFDRLSFELQTISLSTDARGRQVTSCRLVHAESRPADPVNEPPRQSTRDQVLELLGEDASGSGLSVREIMQRLGKAQTTVYDALKSLMDEGLVEHDPVSCLYRLRREGGAE
jgi:DNA-binding transcriptional ArsR family regulator